MRSRAGFLVQPVADPAALLPLILVVGFFWPGSGRPARMRQAAANQSQLQIEPGAPKRVADAAGGAERRSRPLCWCGRTARPTAYFLCPAGAAAGQRTGWHHTGGMYAFGQGGAGRSTAEGRAFHRQDRSTAAVPAGHAPPAGVDCVGSGTAVRFDTSSLLQPPHGWRWATARMRYRLSVPPTRWS